MLGNQRAAGFLTSQEAAEFAGQYADQVSSDQLTMAGSMMSLNPYAINSNFSQAQQVFGGLGGDLSFMQMDDMGRGLQQTQFTPGMIQAARRWERSMGTKSFLGNWTDKQIMQMGGIRGIQGSLNEIQEAQIGMGAAHQRFMFNVTQGLNIGGGSIGAGGFVEGGSLDDLSALYASRGFELQTGNGMTMWQVQDAQTRLSREKQDYSMDRKGQDLEMQRRHFMEKWNLNYEQFQFNTAFSRQKMGWQGEDMQVSQARSAREFGWQQEDYDWNLRYATGRQRTELQRNRRRDVIRRNDQVADEEKQETRFELEKKHFEKSIEYKEEEMEMSKRHFMERLGMQEEGFEKEKQWMIQQRELEDQTRLLQRQHAIFSQEMSVRQSEAAAGLAKQAKDLQDVITGMNSAASDENSKLSRIVNEEGTGILQLFFRIFTQGDLEDSLDRVREALGIVVDDANRFYAAVSGGGGGGISGPTPEAGAMGLVGGMSPMMGQGPNAFSARGMAIGGYTGDGLKYQSAGMYELHKGEIVVPQSGMLVKQGGASDALMREMVGLLREIRDQGRAASRGSTNVNATIYTNQVSKDILTDEDRLRAMADR
jgi:hypothetical protein